MLAGILEQDGSQHSATSTRREQSSPASVLHQAALRYHDALTFAALQTLGSAALAALDAQAEALDQGCQVRPRTSRCGATLPSVRSTAPIP